MYRVRDLSNCACGVVWNSGPLNVMRESVTVYMVLCRVIFELFFNVQVLCV